MSEAVHVETTLDRLAGSESEPNGEKPKTRKICILGKAPDSMTEAPFGEDDWEVWTLNDSAKRGDCPRWDRQFELHPIDWTKEAAYQGYYEWLCQQTKPVYTRDHQPEIPGCVPYPRAEVLAMLAPNAGAEYFTNSISWMIALALYEMKRDGNTKGSEIGLWGVNMAQHGTGAKSEYAAQRPSCEFWAGVAVGMGVKLYVPPQADLLKTPSLYGFDHGWMDAKYKSREQELRGRANQARMREQQAHDEAVFLDGACEGLQYTKQWIHMREEPTE